MFRINRVVALAVAGGLTLSACGSDESPSAESAASTVPAATVGTSAAATSTAAAPAEPADSAGEAPTRIVSLYPTGTEMLFAIGAGEQVIAVDDQSNFPPEAAAKLTDLSGYTPNVEAIAAYQPDLVIHDGTTDVGAQLDALGIAQWAGPAATDFDDIYQQIEQLGVATGHVGEAAELVAQMQADIDAAVARIPEPPAPLTYYHELDSTLFSATSNTFIGQVYGLFGMHNIADTAEGGTDYPQLSAEFIISQDPDIIFLADADYGESPETVAARPGWDVVTAVANGAIVPVGADVSSRWGPRVVEFVEVVADAVAAVTVAG